MLSLALKTSQEYLLTNYIRDIFKLDVLQLITKHYISPKMGNFHSCTEHELAKQIANLNLSITNLSLQQEKFLQEMEATINQLNESITRHQEEQAILSPLVNKVTSSFTIARRRLANIEIEKFGDIDIHEGEYESEYDSGFEGSTQSEARSVFMWYL